MVDVEALLSEPKLQGECHSGQCTKRWSRDPESGHRWLLKIPGCYDPGGGAEAEELAVELLRACGHLSYEVHGVEWEDCYAVAIQHVEDANPAWELVGDFDALRYGEGHLPASLWVPWAAFSITFGFNDRHTGNCLVMQHRETGERRFASIDHECRCEDGEAWPFWLVRPRPFEPEVEMVPREVLRAEVDRHVAMAQAQGLGRFIAWDTIEYVFDLENAEQFAGLF